MGCDSCPSLHTVLKCGNVVDSYGFSTNGYDQIIVFKDPSIFAEILAANPHMTAIMGADDHTREEFPGVYIAAIGIFASQG